MFNELAKAGIDFHFYVEYQLIPDEIHEKYARKELDKLIEEEIEAIKKRAAALVKRADSAPAVRAAREAQENAYEKYRKYADSKLNPFYISLTPVARAEWDDALEKLWTVQRQTVEAMAGDKWEALFAAASGDSEKQAVSDLTAELRNRYRYYESAGGKKQEIISEQKAKEEKGIADMVRKLLSNKNALEKMVNSLVESVKEKDKHVDKGAHVSLISYEFKYTILNDRILTVEKHVGTGFRAETNGLNAYYFEENGYKNLDDVYQWYALALVLGQMAGTALMREPGFEMASITATGKMGDISLHIAYPNAVHTEMVSLF